MKNHLIEENLEILENKIEILLDQVETMNLGYALEAGDSIVDQVQELKDLIHVIRELSPVQA
jgi:hypothetical protein